MHLKLARKQPISAGKGVSACRHTLWDARRLTPAQGALLSDRLDSKARQSLRASKLENRRDGLSCRSLTPTAVNTVTAAATMWPFPIYLLMLVVPAWKWTTKLVGSELIYIPIAAAYLYLLLHSWEPDTLSLIMPGSLKAGLSGSFSPQFFPSLGSISTLFSRLTTAASLWVHLVAINLFAACKTFLEGKPARTATDCCPSLSKKAAVSLQAAQRGSQRGIRRCSAWSLGQSEFSLVFSQRSSPTGDQMQWKRAECRQGQQNEDCNMVKLSAVRHGIARLLHNTAYAQKRLTVIRNRMATGAAQSEASNTAQDRHTGCVALESPKPPFLRVRTTNLGNATACRNSKLAPPGAVPSDAQLGSIKALTDFVQGVEIYNGRQTRVVSCLTKVTRVPVAVKLSVKAGMTEHQKHLVEKEIRISRRLSASRHSGLVRLLNTFEDDHHYYQVLEYCPAGNLYQVLHGRGAPFSEEEVCNKVVSPLLNSLAFMHSQGIVHRDVKLENLLCAGKTVKLADFGLAVDLSEEQPRVCVGTVDYYAPEVTGRPTALELDSQDAELVAAYDEKVDVWAAGVVAYELLFGRAPFYMPDAADTVALIQEGTLPGFMGFLSDDCSDFLQAALRKDPRERPCAAELLGHPWLAFHAEKLQGGAPGSKKPLGSQGAANSTASASSCVPVATVSSPESSVSPRFASWKIQAADSKIEGASPSAEALMVLKATRHRATSRLQAEMEDVAEDIQPRDAGDLSSRTLSFVEAAPQLEVLREEVVESAYGAPAELDPALDANALPMSLAHVQLRRSGSAGKSRFA